MTTPTSWPTLRGFIHQAMVDDPRNQQQEIGPSEVGTPCIKQLAWKRGRAPVYNDHQSWGAFIGKAAHAHLADAAAAENQRLRRQKYLFEHRIRLPLDHGDAIEGSLDLYDTDTRTVIDYKVVGPTTLKNAKANGPTVDYSTQVQLYAAGLDIQGWQPEHVAICYLPRAHSWHDTYLWTAPYDEQVAHVALGRLAMVDQLLDGKHGEHALPLVEYLPTAATHCEWCPAYTGDGLLTNSPGCHGHQAAPTNQGTQETQEALI